MPSGTFAVSNNSAGLSTEIRWRTNDDAAGNQSEVIVELWARRSSSTTFGDGSFVIRIGNDGTVSDGGVAVGTTWVRVVTRTRTVNHNANGALSITIGVVSGGKAGTSWTSTSGTQTVALTDYVRVPSPPGLPSASNVATTSMTLSWATPSDTAGGILEYQLQRALNSGFTSGVSTLGGSTATSRSVTGLSPGTTYYWRARARSGDGWGPWSAVRTQATLVAVPSAPGTPAASNVGVNSLDLAWTAPSNLGGGTLSGYRVQRALNSSFTSGVVNLDGNTTPSRSISGLAAGTTYYFRVAAQNEAGYGAWSSTRTVTTIGVPTAPGTPTISNIGPTGLDLSWAAPSSAGGGTLSGYRVQYATNSAFTSGVVVEEGDTTRARSISDLTPGQTYWFRVAAQNQAGWGPYSGARSSRTLSGAYISDGIDWMPCELFISDGTTDQVGEVYVSDGGTYQPAG